MPFDSALPANHSPLNSAEMRGQLNGLKALIDALPPGVTVAALNDAVAVLGEDINNLAAIVDAGVSGSALNPAAVEVLNLEVSNPPTQAEVQTVADKLNELVAALKR